VTFWFFILVDCVILMVNIHLPLLVSGGK